LRFVSKLESDSMPIAILGPSRVVLDDRAFTPKHIEILADALVLACMRLDVPESGAYERDVIADRIIDLARTGVIDAAALCNRIVLEATLSERQRGQSRSGEAFVSKFFVS
jgi:hypothetical protein